jgi:hypothetical protein
MTADTAVDTPRRVHNLATVDGHVAAEFSNDVEAILATVDPEPRFVVCIPADADERLALSVRVDTPGVEDHYRTLRQSIDVVRSTQVRRVSTDWYVFQQSVATVRDVTTRNEYPIDTAVFFPVDHDGIKGEILWNPASFAEGERIGPGGRAEGPAAALMDVVDAHDAFVEAWRSGDVDRLAGLLAEDCAWATRNYGKDAEEQPMMAGLGSAAIREALAGGLAGWAPVSATVLNRIVTGWYVFAEVLWDMGDGTAVRTGTISGVMRTGRIGGAVGWGTAPEPAPTRA